VFGGPIETLVSVLEMIFVPIEVDNIFGTLFVILNSILNLIGFFFNPGEGLDVLPTGP